MFLFLFRMSGLGGFWSGRGLDKIWVARRWRVVFRSLEHRACEIRGKGNGKGFNAECAERRFAGEGELLDAGVLRRVADGKALDLEADEADFVPTGASRARQEEWPREPMKTLTAVVMAMPTIKPPRKWEAAVWLPMVKSATAAMITARAPMSTRARPS
jgi:hypothetical protein